MKHALIKQDLYNIHLIKLRHKHKDIPLQILQDIDRLLMDKDIEIRKLKFKSVSEKIKDAKDLLDYLEECDNTLKYHNL